MKVPQHIHDGLIAWVMDGRPTGGFLKAVLENDLFLAITKADKINCAALKEICLWIYWEAPSPCSGSKSDVIIWADKGGLNASNN
jgi:hypothetical protein